MTENDEALEKRARRAVQEAHEGRQEAVKALHEATIELGEVLRSYSKKGVSMSVMGEWLVSDDKPRGLSKQQVHNLIRSIAKRKRSGTVSRPAGASPKPKARPTKPKPKIKRKEAA